MTSVKRKLQDNLIGKDGTIIVRRVTHRGGKIKTRTRKIGRIKNRKYTNYTKRRKYKLSNK
jgi:hypothetical protein